MSAQSKTPKVGDYVKFSRTLRGDNYRLNGWGTVRAIVETKHGPRAEISGNYSDVFLVPFDQISETRSASK